MCNLFHTVPQVELARRLTANSFADRVLYANSGSEANEAALKLARKYAWQKEQAGAAPRPEIVAFSYGFHGRTMGALSATYKAQYRTPFEPLVPEVRFAPYNDVAAAAAAIGERTCAVIVEPVQGEGGVRPASQQFLETLREACTKHDALLIFDEIQCGLGRTGHLWAHERYGVTPDLMTLAKPLAGGLPIGALLVARRFAQVFQPGDHGSTFAAGPLVCAAANVVFDEISRPEFLARVRENGAYLMERLIAIQSADIVEVRGAGLLVGVEFDRPVAPLIRAARGNGLLLINSGENVLRLCPPLIISREQIEEAVDTISELLHEW
jgi:acetylornithine/succinyldiaminopimelate/putrescine aminotransferase